MRERVWKVLNRLCKWRIVFAGWQLGTRHETDAECRAVKEHREATMLMRVELSAVMTILKRKGILQDGELDAALIDEAERLDKQYEKLFPGFTATDSGISMDPKIVPQTMKGWRP